MKGFKYMLGVTVEPKLVKELDELRGEVPRSRVVERALNEYVQTWKIAAESKNGTLQNGVVRNVGTSTTTHSQQLSTNSSTGEIDYDKESQSAL